MYAGVEYYYLFHQQVGRFQSTTRYCVTPVVKSPLHIHTDAYTRVRFVATRYILRYTNQLFGNEMNSFFRPYTTVGNITSENIDN